MRLAISIILLLLASLEVHPQTTPPCTADELSFVVARRAEAEAMREEDRVLEAIEILTSLRASSCFARNSTVQVEVLFDLARSYAAIGDVDRSIASLTEAISTGRLGYRTIENESDFAPLRMESRFIALTRDLAARQLPWWNLWQPPAEYEDEGEPLSENLRIAGLSTLWSEVKRNYAYFDRVADLDWDSLYIASIPAVRAASSTIDYYRQLQRICARLRDGHTEIDYPPSLRDSLFCRPGFDTRIVGDSVFVSALFERGLADVGVVPGIAVVSIDGMNVHDYARAHVMPYQSASTPHDLRSRTYEHRLLSGAFGTNVAIGFRRPNGTTFARTVTRRYSEDDLFRMRSTIDTATLPGNIAYMRLNTFYDEYLSELVAARLAAMSQSDGLVIDLRENGGGFTDVALDVLALFIDTAFATHAWESPLYIPYERAEGHLPEWSAHPAEIHAGGGERAYDKPIVLLAGPRTYSAAEHFLVAFRQARRGIVIGEPSGGSTGHALEVGVPGGGVVYICTTRDYFADGSLFNGVGVRPDIEVPPTAEEIRSGGDRALELALHVLGRHPGPSAATPVAINEIDCVVDRVPSIRLSPRSRQFVGASRAIGGGR